MHLFKLINMSLLWSKCHHFILIIIENVLLQIPLLRFVSECYIRLQTAMRTCCEHRSCFFSSLKDNSCWSVKLIIRAAACSPHLSVSRDTSLRLLRSCWQWSVDSSSIILFSAFIILSSSEKLSIDAINLLWFEVALLTRSVVFLQQQIFNNSEILKGRF